MTRDSYSCASNPSAMIVCYFHFPSTLSVTHESSLSHLQPMPHAHITPSAIYFPRNRLVNVSQLLINLSFPPCPTPDDLAQAFVLFLFSSNAIIHSCICDPADSQRDVLPQYHPIRRRTSSGCSGKAEIASHKTLTSAHSTTQTLTRVPLSSNHRRCVALSKNIYKVPSHP